MLPIEVPLTPEGWDEEKEEFVPPKVVTLQLEHSLVSLSKWESKWQKPFLTKASKSFEETIDYIKCMTLNPNVNPDIYNHLTRDNINKINKYIENPMTATTFRNDRSGKNSSEQPTSELIYYWMIANNIPFECQKWHLNRLMTLIKICGTKSQPPKKMSRGAILRQNAALNASRRKRLNSKG